MKKTLLFACLITAVLWRPAARAADAPAAVSPLAALAWMPGGVWHAEIPGDKDTPVTTIDLRFTWSENQHALLFNTAFGQGGRSAPTYSGMYAWNGATKKLVIFYTDRGGGLIEGPVTAEGDSFVHELTIIGADGKAEQARVRLTKIGPDAFTNTIFVPKDGQWVKFVEVHYARR